MLVQDMTRLFGTTLCFLSFFYEAFNVFSHVLFCYNFQSLKKGFLARLS